MKSKRTHELVEFTSLEIYIAIFYSKDKYKVVADGRMIRLTFENKNNFSESGVSADIVRVYHLLCGV